MTIIKVIDVIGPRCISASHGQQLFDLLNSIYTTGNEATIDFEQVKLFASPFFNYSIGQLFTQYDEAKLRSTLHLVNLNQVGHMIVSKVVENSLAFKSNSDLKETLEMILAQQNGE